MPNPDPDAVKAARAFYTQGHKTVYNKTYLDELVHQLAIIIDRETKLPEIKAERRELMEALRDIRDIGFDYDGCDTADGLGGLVDDLVGLAKAAIAKVEGQDKETKDE